MDHAREGGRDHRGYDMTRREILRRGIAAGAILGLGGCAGLRGGSAGKPAGSALVGAAEVPRAVLGRTGVEVSVLGLGTGSLGHQNKDSPETAKLVRVFSHAVDRGITYVDTAPTYGGAQKALKEILATRRDRVFLATKVHAETWEEAEALVDGSLRDLGVDHVDLLHLHNVGAKDLDRVLGPRGSWEYFQRARRDGKARFLGMTGHERPAKFVRMLETGTVDAMMVVLNFVDRHTYRFEEIVLPAARKQGTGVMAMKVFGGLRGGFASYGSKDDQPSKLEVGHERAIAYVRSLEGVTGMVIGVFSTDEVERNIRAVAAARPLAPPDFERLSEEGKALAPAWGERLGPPA